MQEFKAGNKALANRLADEAGEIIRQYFRQPFDIETKDDDTPVTIADRAVEARMREILENERPQDGIYGEEYGVKESKSGFTWVLDPIDGTKSFMIGRPTFGTLIALCEGDKPILGVIDQAILGERWTGDGEQCLFNGKPVKSRKCKTLSKAVVGSTTPAMFNDIEPVYEKFETQCKMIWGGDCYMYGLMANGYLDVIIEANMQPYDYLAHVPIIEGAGGHISDFDGNPLTLNSGDTVVACGDPDLWPAVRDLINS